MKSIHKRSFLDLWRALYQDSNPGAEANAWHVGDVAWSREIHGFHCPAYSFRLEAHRLTRVAGTEASWTLLVVVEQWRRPGSGKVLKSAVWCQVLAGRKHHVLEWFSNQRRRREAAW